MFPRRDGRLLVSCSSSCPCSMIVLGPPCSSCTVGPSWSRLRLRRTLAPTSHCLDPPLASMPLPPSYRPSTHPRCVERRCRIPSWPRPRRLVYHDSRALPARFFPTPVASRRRDMPLLSFFPPALPFQGQGFCLRLYRASARRGTVHPSSLCRVLYICRGFHDSLPEGGSCDSLCHW